MSRRRPGLRESEGALGTAPRLSSPRTRICAALARGRRAPPTPRVSRSRDMSRAFPQKFGGGISQPKQGGGREGRARNRAVASAQTRVPAADRVTRSL